MDREEYEELLSMLAVLYERLDKLEKKVNGGFRMASRETYLTELRKEASKMKK